MAKYVKVIHHIELANYVKMGFIVHLDKQTFTMTNKARPEFRLLRLLGVLHLLFNPNPIPSHPLPPTPP